MSTADPALRPGAAPDFGATLPESIPTPPAPDEHLLRREAFLLLFCAAFAATVFAVWSWVYKRYVHGSPNIQAIENLKDILGPFLTAYVAARLYSTMVRRYERQLQRHRLLLAHILDTSVDGIVTLDNEDRISTWNHGAEQIFGYQESEILGQHASILYPPEEDATAQLERMRTDVEDAGVMRAHYGERITRDGRRIRTEISATCLRDAAGRYAGRASIIRDVTERDRIRDELARREHLAAIGEMAAAVAHEIRNPLAGIGGAVKVIARKIPEDDATREVIDEIQAQVRRLDETIRDLHRFARPITPRLASLDLAEFAGRVLRVIGEVPDLKRHAIEVSIPPDLVVRADPQLMENILINLLLNAGQAMGATPGTIRLGAVDEPAHTRIAVSDSGPGVPEDVRPRLFKPFFTTKARGTGLGLTVVRKFVDAMGGRIEVESGPEKGATFTVQLPREEVARP